uniref:Uncharacterized protein n=1 Tax=Lepeophtheirus salmonis TaxID=72036 RepID=A0A0K2T7C9_LEPSM
MNTINMPLQASRLCKRTKTVTTLEFFNLLMNTFNMSLQVSRVCKRTRAVTTWEFFNLFITINIHLHVFKVSRTRSH